MKRAVLIGSGIVLLVLGVLLIAGGGAVAAVFGSDGSLSTAPARVSGSGVALVIEDIAIDASSIPVPDGVGTLTLSVSGPRGSTMFVGSASGDAVDAYLTGAPYDVVVEIAAGSDATTREVPGTQQPPPPSTQPIWTRQATGSPAQLTVRSGSATTLVVMNSAATSGVTADLVVTLTVARAWTYAWVAVGAGVVLVLLSIVAFWRARVARRRARAASATTVPAPAPVVATPGATILPGEDVTDGSVEAHALVATPEAEPVAVEPIEPPAPQAAVVAEPDAAPVAPDLAVGPAAEDQLPGAATVGVPTSEPPGAPDAPVVDRPCGHRRGRGGARGHGVAVRRRRPRDG